MIVQLFWHLAKAKASPFSVCAQRSMQDRQRSTHPWRQTFSPCATAHVVLPALSVAAAISRATTPTLKTPIVFTPSLVLEEPCLVTQRTRPRGPLTDSHRAYCATLVSLV